MSSQGKELRFSQKGTDKQLVKKLKTSAKKMMKLRADAKSIILVESNGQV